MTRRSSFAASRLGFTLVELLVTIAIIGVLVALLLPALQAARESSRNTQCKNNLKQIGLAALNFESAHGAMPAGGWSAAWIGDPNVGPGPRQPGSWIFQVAPYLEANTQSFPGVGANELNELRAALAELARVPLPLLNCPTRRIAKVYPAYESKGINYAPFTSAAKSDYAANGGNRMATGSIGSGPLLKYPFEGSVCRGGFPNCRWVSSDDWLTRSWNGVVGDHTGATTAQITDGVSYTLLAAEKWVHGDYYEIATIDSQSDLQLNGTAHDNLGDSGSMYLGFDYDNVRVATDTNPPRHDREYLYGHAQSDKHGSNYKSSFGSAHPLFVNLVKCDGSVGEITFDIDRRIWSYFAARNDGTANLEQ